MTDQQILRRRDTSSTIPLRIDTPDMPNALCKGAGDPWFDDTHNGPQRAQAIKTCNACLDRRICATYAIEADIPYGVFGGLTPPERKEIRRQQGQVAA